MEKGKVIVIATADSKEIVPVRDNKVSGTKKKHSAMHLLRAAMFMLRRRPSRKNLKPLYAEVASAEVLNKVVGSMRPLHAQSNQSPAHALVPVAAALPSPQDVFVDVPQSPATMIVPPSPDHSSTTSDGGTSRYASALNLQELDKIDDDQGKNEETSQDNDCGDEMIDLKVDKFIARFYEQMRIQNQNEMDRRSKRRHHHHHDRLSASHVRAAGGMNGWMD